jgi:hypothetical protein
MNIPDADLRKVFDMSEALTRSAGDIVLEAIRAYYDHMRGNPAFQAALALQQTRAEANAPQQTEIDALIDGSPNVLRFPAQPIPLNPETPV